MRSRLSEASEWWGVLAIVAGTTFLAGFMPVTGQTVESLTESSTSDGTVFEFMDASGGSGSPAPGGELGSAIGYAARTIGSGGASFAARYGMSESPWGTGLITGDRFYERNASNHPGHIYATDTAYLTELELWPAAPGSSGRSGCDRQDQEPSKGCDVGNASMRMAYQHGTAFLSEGSGSSSVTVGRGGSSPGIGSERSVSGNGYASFGAGISSRSGTSAGQVSQTVDYREDVSVSGSRFDFRKGFRYSPD